MTLVSLAAAWLLGVYVGFQLGAPVFGVVLFLVAAGLLAALCMIARRLRLVPVLASAGPRHGARRRLRRRPRFLTGDVPLSSSPTGRGRGGQRPGAGGDHDAAKAQRG